jgi:hypothetical protein
VSGGGSIWGKGGYLVSGGEGCACVVREHILVRLRSMGVKRKRKNGPVGLLCEADLCCRLDLCVCVCVCMCYTCMLMCMCMGM